MKTPLVLLFLSFICLKVCAFKQETHKRLVLDAVAYMKQNPETTQYKKLQEYADKYDITIDDLANVMGQGAYDVDDFEDTFFCGAITGDCVQAPVWDIAGPIVKYTSYWHFQNHTQGTDIHGNDFGGYNYDKLTVWGEIDNLAAAWLVGDYLDDGAGGETGWLSADDTRLDSYSETEQKYRLDSHSTYSMYEDFETMPFQPIDNLGQYWYQIYLESGDPETLGFVFHTTDLLQPHHTWTTSDLNHASWEAWVMDYYDRENLNDMALVKDAMAYYTPIPDSEKDIRALLTEGGRFSYEYGGIVLNSTEHHDRVEAGQAVIPHAIAMVVHLLNHAMVAR